MIDTHKLKQRDYLQKLIAFQDTGQSGGRYSPLQKINDNYEKIVLSLDTGLDSSYEGIKSINLINWLLENK